MVIMENTTYDEESQSTVGGKPLLSISSVGESSELSSELSEQKSNATSTSSSNVKDTSKLHIHKFKATALDRFPQSIYSATTSHGMNVGDEA